MRNVTLASHLALSQGIRIIHLDQDPKVEREKRGNLPPVAQLHHHQQDTQRKSIILITKARRDAKLATKNKGVDLIKDLKLLLKGTMSIIKKVINHTLMRIIKNILIFTRHI